MHPPLVIATTDCVVLVGIFLHVALVAFHK